MTRLEVSTLYLGSTNPGWQRQEHKENEARKNGKQSDVMCFHAGHCFTMSYDETQEPLGRDVGSAPGTSPEDLQEEIKS